MIFTSFQEVSNKQSFRASKNRNANRKSPGKINLVNWNVLLSFKIQVLEKAQNISQQALIIRNN